MSKARWVETTPREAWQRHWQLIYGDLFMAVGDIQQFSEGGPYYGTWERAGDSPGGRTGAMEDLEECKRKVEERAKVHG